MGEVGVGASLWRSTGDPSTYTYVEQRDQHFFPSEALLTHRNLSFDRVRTGVLVQERDDRVVRRVLLVVGHQRRPQGSVDRRVGLKPAKGRVTVSFASAKRTKSGRNT